MFSPQSVSTLKSDPGVIGWANRLASGWSDAAVLSALLSNPQRYAGLGGTNRSFVSSLYPETLARGADAGGLAYHTAELSSGVALPGMVGRFIASPEGHLATVARLYRDDLGSTYSVAQLEPDHGVQVWAGYLGSD